MTSIAALPALVLNADFRPLSYYPLSTWSAEDAIKAVFRGKVSVVAEYDRTIRSPSVEMKVPSVIALREYVAPPKRVAFTRFNVFLRDRFTCQYCGEGPMRANDLSFDHVKPRSKGGHTSWDNIVAACLPCNLAKGNRPLAPRSRPHEPTAWELNETQRQFPPNYLHESWVDFLYWDAEIAT